jgi:alpha-1,3-glucosyltransferase
VGLNAFTCVQSDVAGHFQYNGVSLGLALVAIHATSTGRDCLGGFFFVLALNYKQMCLYYALPFFVYMLAKAVRSGSVAAVVVQLGRLGVSPSR